MARARSSAAFCDADTEVIGAAFETGATSKPHTMLTVRTPTITNDLTFFFIKSPCSSSIQQFGFEC